MTGADDTVRVVIPLTVRKRSGRPKILPPEDHCARVAGRRIHKSFAPSRGRKSGGGGLREVSSPPSRTSLGRRLSPTAGGSYGSPICRRRCWDGSSPCRCRRHLRSMA